MTVTSKETPWITRILAFPLVVLVCIGALGSIVWLDVIYGAGVVYIVAQQAVNVFA